MREPQVVLITGTSTGMGHATARWLAERGMRVFGGSLDPEEDEPIPGAEVLPLDVRQDAAVQACIDGVLRRAGRLDVLVNNAGYALCGALEEFSIDEAKAQFETNFFGIVVSLVEPGSCRTPIVRHAKVAARSIDAYSSRRRRVLALVKEHCEKGTDPIRVARCVERIIRSRWPRLRYRVGPDVTMSYWLRRFLPESLFQRMVRDYYRMDS